MNKKIAGQPGYRKTKVKVNRNGKTFERTQWVRDFPAVTKTVLEPSVYDIDKRILELEIPLFDHDNGRPDSPPEIMWNEKLRKQNDCEFETPDGTSLERYEETDVKKEFHYINPDSWVRESVTVHELEDGRWVTWYDWNDMTGGAFCYDAYGGGGTVVFAADYDTLIRYGMDDQTRKTFLKGIEKQT